MADALKPEAPTGRFAYDGLDRVIHERARLGIMTGLAAHPGGLSFTDLKELCQLTDGNLSRHLDMLRQAELVRVSKDSAGGRPRTRCRITAHGRKRFLAYLAELERVVTDASGATESAESAPWSEAPTGGSKA